jgi:hypothetical protein
VSRSPVDVRGRRGMGGHSRPNDGATVEWYTPPGLFDRLGLEFDLDPAHPEKRLPWVPAKRTYSKAEDGLARPWEGRVWLNPPYGRETGVWLERFVEHGHGLALVFARTETEWWHRFALAVDAWTLIRGRLTFVDRHGEPGTSNAGAPSAILAAGEDCVEALRRARLGIDVAVTERAQPLQASLWGAGE